MTGGATSAEAEDDELIRLMTNLTWLFSSPQAFHSLSMREDADRGRSTPLHCSTSASCRLILRQVRSSDFSDRAGLLLTASCWLAFLSALTKA